MEFFSHCIKRNEKGLQGRATAGMLIILVALSLLGWIYLSQASHVTTTGRKVRALEDREEELHKQNLELMAEIAELESVSRLAARAEELGFVQAPLEDASFLLVQAVPEVTETSLADGTVAARLWGNVASQFAAWVRAESR